MPRSQQPGLLDLPLHLLSNILGILAPKKQAKRLCPRAAKQQLQQEKEQKQEYAAAISACKSLWQARDAVPFKTTLFITTEKYSRARQAGHERALLGFLARKAPMLRTSAVVALELDEDVQQALSSLGGVQELHLHFSSEFFWFVFPERLAQLTSITHLTIDYSCFGELTRLSTLTALETLMFNGCILPQLTFPPHVFSTLRRLTNLELGAWDPYASDGPSIQLTAAHLSACPALRRLCLPDNEGWGQVQLLLSAKEASCVLQQLEELTFSEIAACANAATWRALQHLPRLTKLCTGTVEGEVSEVLWDCLPAFLTLACLELVCYSEPDLPQLPSTLTSLTLFFPTSLETVPLVPSLCSFSMLESSESLDGLEWPAEITAFTRLTSLALEGCQLTELPDWVAALPALEVLKLPHNQLDDLPELGCISSLRHLVLMENRMRRVPAALAGASRLTCLLMAGWYTSVVDEVGLAILSSLAALKVLALSLSYRVRPEDLTEEDEDHAQCMPHTRLCAMLPGVDIMDVNTYDMRNLKDFGC